MNKINIPNKQKTEDDNNKNIINNLHNKLNNIPNDNAAETKINDENNKYTYTNNRNAKPYTIKINTNYKNNTNNNGNANINTNINTNLKTTYPSSINVKTSYQSNINVKNSYPSSTNVKNSYTLTSNIKNSNTTISSNIKNTNTNTSTNIKNPITSTNTNIKTNYTLNKSTNIKTTTDKQKSKAQDKMGKLMSQGKSALLLAKKKECTICHKFIETHLHQIHYNSHPSQIFKWMYLGNFDSACNISDLRRLGIKYVLNLAGECKNTLLPKSIVELHLKMKDLENFDVFEYFEKANEFINTVRNSGGTILVHCKYGVSRSPSFVIAYLVKYYPFTVDSALKFVKKRRPCINPNAGFLEQLEKYENTFKKKPQK